MGSGVAADAGVAAGALEALAGVTSLFVGVFSFDELTGDDTNDHDRYDQCDADPHVLHATLY